MVTKRKVTKTAKKIIDVLMLLMLPILAAEIQLGQESHEWLGIGMIGLFILHHALNYKWIKGMFQGAYSPVRAFVTALNLLLLLDFMALAYSGLKMSGFVLKGLAIPGSTQTARILHLFASEWSFILISLHTGVHSGLHGSQSHNGRLTDGLDQRGKAKFVRGAGYLFVSALSVFGAYAFLDLKIPDYLFLRTHFMFYDESKSLVFYFAEMICTMVLFGVTGHLATGLLKKIKGKDKGKKAAKILAFLLPVVICLTVIFALNHDAPNPGSQNSGQASWGNSGQTQAATGFSQNEGEKQPGETAGQTVSSPASIQDGFHITWLDAVSFCNALSERCGLTSVYTVEGNTVTWDRSANGYRLPTEAEWEYACRAGTVTPFNTENIPGADICNFYGHYPYQIEQNYFTQNKLSTKPGIYRQTTVPADSFEPNGWGLYNMHGNVSEWVWDYYGEYDMAAQQDPTGAATGNLRVYRGGGWNDFGKNTRSAYRGAMAQNMAGFNVGMRLVRNAVSVESSVSSKDTRGEAADGGKILIVFFSWGGNTRGIARKIQEKTGADLFEIQLVQPYSSDYNTVLDEAQHDQNIQARPEIANKIENFDDYDIILIGYPNWWASIPMPIASLLKEYDFSGKTILPFCSHGGGRFGQSITAISKLAADSVIGEGLSVHYSGGSSLGADIDEWLEKNHIR